MFRLLAGSPRPPRSSPSVSAAPAPLRLFTLIGLAVYAAELLVMTAFFYLPPLAPVPEAVVDATALTLLITPVLYVFGFRPLAREIAERRRVEAELRGLYANMEKDVEEKTRAQSVILSVSRRLATVLEPQQLLVDVVEQVREAFQYYHVQIYLYDNRRENLVMVGGTGEAGQQMLTRGHQLSAGRGLVGRAAAAAQAVIVPDTTQDPGWLPNPLLPETRAEVAVPIIAGSQVLGVLDVQHHVAGGLGQRDADLLLAVANQVGVALQNAWSYEAARRQAQSEALINSITQQIQTASSLESVLDITAREVGQALGAQRATARLTGQPAAANGQGSA
ncbi:MAG: GAF domain-containing protein [Anaerolineales bacterium]|nr:GAF domain-containing protein [Anaerolineales bacterium]